MTRKPRPPRPPEIDDDPPAAAPPNAHDVDHLMRLLSWARANGYALGPMVQVGAAVVQVADIRLAKREGAAGNVDEDRGIYAEHGLKETDTIVDGTL